MKISVLMAEGFEEAEAVIVIDILRRAGFEVNLVSTTNEKKVTGGRKIKIFADYIFEEYNFENADILFIPGGGLGVENLLKSSKVENLIKKYFDQNKYIVAICAAPLVLEKAGVLKGKKVTSYPSTEENLKSIAEYSSEKVVVDGKIITSRGFGTAMDLGLKLVEIFLGKQESDNIKKAVVY
ncbi:MAG TPA: DJ-1/PfpI family protein [Spirochaetota bacterium]|nr:DJ-1/PfpI family protein [Spirochaetota bacterium]